MNILLIDNYDSFVHNISRYFTQLGANCRVVRNNMISLEQIRKLQPNYIILSPGPCTPNEAGITLAVIKEFYQSIPILGICLGHQAIGQAFGASIKRAKKPMHGKASRISHNNCDLFTGLKNPISVGRYHSLIVSEESLSNELDVLAYSQENEIMALAHKLYPLYGFQFHPESILTECGYEMLKNFLNLNHVKNIGNTFGSTAAV